jgi:hypothetical protein
MQENSKVMWKKFEFGLREEFGGKKILDLEMVNNEQFC